jgi:Zn-dependent peptidase ImmA (M78 family)
MMQAMSKPPNANPYIQAQELLASLSIKTSPTPVEKIAKALGVQVRFAPFDDELAGMVYVKDGVPIIGVNSLHHPNRQRFTIAHELGHLEYDRDMITSSIHVDKGFPVLMRNSNSTTGTEQIEIRANQFASELLMPSALIEQELAGKPFDIDDDAPIEKLAKKFRVSKQALEYKIRNYSQAPVNSNKP